ncbi:MAG: phosphomannomutase, partial [Desulfoplanes sp.]
MKPINQSIFRAYDIRGIVGKDFDEEWVERLGKACGTFFIRKGHSHAVVAHDCRQSSYVYQARMVQGLLDAGMQVTFI